MGFILTSYSACKMNKQLLYIQVFFTEMEVVKPLGINLDIYIGDYRIDKVLTFAETLWNLLWFVSLICFLYLFPSPLLVAVVTNYLWKNDQWAN